ncbi:ABC transporter substrate-binding protein [Lichenihabitans sp. PAMC28606]|uniref:ABC transporter substrate-binding protein n=1 Tax=Lichenihabitans sp. PAMC28606 TaxID=2880932 RepID=UPI001D0B8DE9|nr:ABC transporter substrate-binding protein [Lichenihabitans sp. PAMC28606]UDL96000.1 ABC transporter substrate-binding protein [Lichenihabitans sp. PAMC28606]
MHSTAATMTQPLTLTHGGALSNLPLFLALDAELFAPLGLDVFAAPLDGFGSTAGRLRDGTAAIGTTGFTQVLADATSHDPLVAVAGSGLRGMAVLGRRGATLKGLVGATVGTFADDPMQVLLADVLAHHGLDGRVHVRMMRSLQAAADGLEQGEFQAVTTIEPWISLLRGRGATLLSDGTDVWGPDYPDTILVARRSVVDTAPDQIVTVIRAMLRAERMIGDHPRSALRAVAHRFPGFSLDQLSAGLVGQPPCVDLRGKQAALLDRWPTVRRLAGLPPDPVPSTLVDFRCLARAVEAEAYA